MKKAILIIIILAALGFGVGFYMSSKSGNNSTSNTLANNSTNSTSVGTTNNNTTSSTASNNSSGNENNTVNTSNSSQNTSATSSQSNSSTSSENSGESYTLNSPLFSDEYQSLYTDIIYKLHWECIPGPYPITNLNLSKTVDGVKYYYVYTQLSQPWAMGGFPGPEQAYGYVSASGKKLVSNDLTEIINQFNNQSNQVKYNQIYQIATQYIVDHDAGASLNSQIPKLDIDLNKTIQKDGQTLYSVRYAPTSPNGFKDPTAQMYVSGTGLIYLPDFFTNFAKIFMCKSYVKTWEVNSTTGL